MQTARYLAGYGERNYTSSPLKLGYRVTALRLGVSYDQLEEVTGDFLEGTYGGDFYYVAMPSGDGVAFHEIDDESYALLQSIVIEDAISDHRADLEITVQRILSGPQANAGLRQVRGNLELAMNWTDVAAEVHCTLLNGSLISSQFDAVARRRIAASVPQSTSQNALKVCSSQSARCPEL